MSAQNIAAGTRVFDAHVHLDKGLTDYDLEVGGKNFIFNDVASYRDVADAYRSDRDAITLIVDNGSDFSFLRQEAESGRIDGLKIHSRISKLQEHDWPTIRTRIEQLPPHLPIVIDAFYFGADLRFQPSLAGIIDLLTNFPQRTFVIAHSGGYRLLEYFFHLREFTNCHYELALSLQYFEDSSVFQDIRKLIRFTDKSKILYGSDFPFASPRRQFEAAMMICDALELSETERDEIMYANGARIFGKRESTR